MEINQVVVCPNCDGKGHVLDGIATVFSVIGLIMAPFERNDKDGLTREKCGQCKGTGFIKVRTH